MTSLTEDLDALKAARLYRARRVVERIRGAEVRVDGKPLLNFSGNDYLGLADHPEVMRACVEAVQRHGVGSGAAHLVTGHCALHERLEETLAVYTGLPRALYFSTGYMANLGIFDALAGRGTTIYQDRLNHASLLDGARLAGARLRRYPHGDIDTLAAWLNESRGGDALIATDAVFSMDGDLAPLPTLVALSRQHRAWLVVDDAHGLGVLGIHGRGSLEHWGISPNDAPILMGTLGKAFGTFGAFVAGDAALIDYLIQRARSYRYTTAPPPALAAATLAALTVAGQESWRRAHLFELIQRFRQGAKAHGLRVAASPTPIQPLWLGDAATALAWSAALETRGFLVTAIRPPTVPHGTARLRISLSTTHTVQDIDRLTEALAELHATTIPFPTTQAM